jgi:hypothetical protein
MVHSASPGLSLDAWGILLVASLSGTPLSSAALLRVEITVLLPPDFSLPSSGIFLPHRFDSVFLVAAILQVTSWALALSSMENERPRQLNDAAHLQRPCLGWSQVVVASIEHHLKASIPAVRAAQCLLDHTHHSTIVHA